MKTKYIKTHNSTASGGGVLNVLRDPLSWTQKYTARCLCALLCTFLGLSSLATAQDCPPIIPPGNPTAPIDPADVTLNITGTSLDSISVAGNTDASSFILLPNQVSYQFAVDNNPTSVDIVENGNNVTDITQPDFDAELIRAYTNNDMQHYLALDNTITNTDYTQFRYPIPVVSSGDRYVVFAERNGNNGAELQAIDASGTLIGTAAPIISRFDAGSTYFDTGIVSDISNQNMWITVYPMTSLVPAGQIFSGIRLTQTGSTGDGGDGKVFVIISPFSQNSATIRNVLVTQPDCVNTTTGAVDVQIDVNATGTVEYSLSGAAGPFQASSLFTNVPPGTYTPYTRIVGQPECNDQAADITINPCPESINAEDDNYAATPVAPGQTLPTVFGNDTSDGSPSTDGNTTTPTVTSDPSSTGVTINAAGVPTVPVGTPPGTYTITYEICLESNNAVCDTADVIFTVINGSTILAEDDDYTATPVDSTSGGTLPSVFTNDVSDGDPSNNGNTTTPNVTSDPSSTGVTIDPNGIPTVPPGTPTGTYTITYEICLEADGTVCDTADVTFLVEDLATIDAVDDTPVTGAAGDPIPTVYGNDTSNGAPSDDANTTTPTVVDDGGLTGITFNPDGTSMIPAGTAPGSYVVEYGICLEANPAICDTAFLPITVEEDPDETTLPTCSDNTDNDGDGLIDCADPDCEPYYDVIPCPENTLPLCSDGIDNDGDNLADCADPDCAPFYGAIPCPENTLPLCSDGIDNDGDGVADCEDPDCAPFYEQLGCDEDTVPKCQDGVDNDGDNLVDCADPDCQDIVPTPCVENTLPLCSDGLDNDGDNVIDCADPDCEPFYGAIPCPENTLPLCSDGIDNDGDAVADCLDPDCAPFYDTLGCNEDDPTECGDGVDNDGDGLIDCEDPSCQELGAPVCPENTLPLCSDGIDNDGDNVADCADPDCQPFYAAIPCIENTLPLCSDGVDNDGDAVADCDDPDCEPFYQQLGCNEDDPIHCSDGIDNDGDGGIDCADDECQALGAPVCPENTLPLCSDGIDNDGDNVADCLDPDCEIFYDAIPCPEDTAPLCSDGIDNDSDGVIDCEDPGCQPFAEINGCDENTLPLCDDGIDNDGDGVIDCDDPDCLPFAADLGCTETTVGDCTDGQDNDGDGAIDCQDPDCQALGAPTCQENTNPACQDGYDNDGDGLVDCADPDCLPFVDEIGCNENTPTTCTDGLDNDGDQLVDCDDPDCQALGAPTCPEDTPALCIDGIDNDGDGLVDCEDPGCQILGGAACEEDNPVNCSDGIDNDGDGAVDCEDPDCQALGAPTCLEDDPVTCNDGLDNDGDGVIDCLDPGCLNYVDLTGCNENTIPGCTDGLDNDGDNLVDCEDPDCLALGGIDCPEDDPVACSDGFDNDGDGFIDCGDPDCAGIAPQNCNENTVGKCNDDADNDGDGLIDCLDPDCAGLAQGCDEGTFQTCTDGIDNDGDLKIDCADEDCQELGAPVCTENNGDTCFDGLDNDGDGVTDCEDPGCQVFVTCQENTPTNCIDGQDNDNDGLIDCEDPECALFGSPICDENTVALCTDGIDNDGDGEIDCEDDQCVSLPGVDCPENTPVLCQDGLDNDSDGVIDCLDPDCIVFEEVGCNESTTGACSDGLDNDGDGLVDCADDECKQLVVCEENNPTTCADGLDNDADGLVDCADPDCINVIPDCVDTDNDTIPDVVDLDDDNDGIPDEEESIVVDPVTGDPVLDPTTGEPVTDPTLDSDDDTIPNIIDLDSDNDGILDVTEADHDAPDDDNDGRVDGPVGEDGIPDSVQTGLDPDGGDVDYVPTNTDDNGPPDYLDLDSDDDGINDVMESDGDDVDRDGYADGPVDPDGIPSSVDPGGNPEVDTDGDTIPDQEDLDTDNDGILDVEEGPHPGTDTDGDGMVDGPDSDGDGIQDPADGDTNTPEDQNDPLPPNTDGDELPNWRDLDSDGDFCPDALEGDGGFTTANLSVDTSLVSPEDAMGVPMIANGGQAPNEAYNAALSSGCPEDTLLACQDGIDNDGDGVADCLDPGCLPFVDENGCNENTPTACADGFDNDGDNVIDCEDPDCIALGAPTCDVIDAVDDNFAGTNVPPGGTTPSVYGNDTSNEVPSEDPNTTTPTVVNDGGLTGVTFNPDGTANVPADTPDGDYVVTYEICLEVNNAICDTATVEIVVENPNENTPDNCQDGLDNDGDDLIDCADPECLPFAEELGCNENTPVACADGLDNDADGMTDCMDPDCLALGAPVCNVIDAVDDNFAGTPVPQGGTTPSVYGNDTSNEDPSDDPNTTTPTVVNDGGLTGITFNPDGTANIPATTPDGDYLVTYEICLEVANTVCDTAVVEIVVENPGEDTPDNCQDGLDNDGDGAIDCADPDCLPFAEELGCNENTPTACADGLDNDGDGAVDCEDPDCEALGAPTCDVIDAVDDNFAGTNVPQGGTTPSVYGNDTSNEVPSDNPNTTTPTVVNDGGLTGVTFNPDGTANIPTDTPDGDYVVTYEICLEVNNAVCDTATVEIVVENPNENTPDNCQDGLDNDGDSLIDCADPECQPFAEELGCNENTPTSCLDGLDNDGDGLVDCADPDCLALPDFSCPENTPAACTDGFDNDGDGNTDCGDPGCAAVLEADCNENNPTACADGIDNDGDGAVDCDDPDCEELGAPVCNVIDAVDDNFSGTPTPQGDTTPSVYGNDTTNGAPSTDPTTTTPVVVNDGGLNGVTFNPDGTANIPLLTPDGTYVVAYEICVEAASTVCDTATVIIVVENPEEDTVDNCQDGLDNDGDGAIDCADPDCQPFATELGCNENTPEACADGLDNDGDGRVDCEDMECVALGSPTCDTINAVNDNFSSTPVEQGGTTPSVYGNDTTNGTPSTDPTTTTPTVVNDGGLTGVTFNPDGTATVPGNTPDGTYIVIYEICVEAASTVCDDAFVVIVVENPGEDTADNCQDGLDNDGDGAIDCNDTDCIPFASALGCNENTPTSCLDGQDNDADGLIDCEDPECLALPDFNCPETTPQACTDGFDNDGDGQIDCEDPGCAAVIVNGCNENTPEACADGIDNDGDGVSDCDDADCAGIVDCEENTEVTCQDGLDNDSDGNIDCDDAGCEPFYETIGCEDGCETFSEIDTDSDVFSLTEEYVFGGNPSIGDHYVYVNGVRTSHPVGLVISENYAGLPTTVGATVEAKVTKPVSVTDANYVLQFIENLEDAVANGSQGEWSNLGSPTVTDNADGTETLTWADLQGATGSVAKGFIRLYVNTPCDPEGRYSLIQGWSQFDITGRLQTEGMPFTTQPLFTGKIDTVSGAVLNVAGSSMGTDIGSLMTGGKYFIELTSGAYEGHRFDLASGGVNTVTVDNLLPAAGDHELLNNSTLASVPAGAAGANFIIREHHTLGSLYKNDEYDASNSASLADQIQVYNGTGYDVYYNVIGLNIWGDTSGQIPDGGAVVVPPGRGVFIEHVNETDVNTELRVGAVRYNKFRNPLYLGQTGLQHLALGFPVDSSPESIDMDSADFTDFTSSNTAGGADQIQVWQGDAAPGTRGYDVHFHASLDPGFWSDTATGADSRAALLFEIDRAVFFETIQDNFDWNYGMPYSPEPWVQP